MHKICQKNHEKCYDTNDDIYVIIADKIDGNRPWDTSAQPCCCRPDCQEAYFHDLVDHPQGVLMMRLTILH